MNSLLKKGLAILVLLNIAFLTACGGDDSKSNDVSKSETEATTVDVVAPVVDVVAPVAEAITADAKVETPAETVAE